MNNLIIFHLLLVFLTIVNSKNNFYDKKNEHKFCLGQQIKDYDMPIVDQVNL